MHFAFFSKLNNIRVEKKRFVFTYFEIFKFYLSVLIYNSRSTRLFRYLQSRAAGEPEGLVGRVVEDGGHVGEDHRRGVSDEVVAVEVARRGARDAVLRVVGGARLARQARQAPEEAVVSWCSGS